LRIRKGCSRKSKKRKKRISSGDKLVDWMFVSVIHALNKDAEDIYKVKDLRDPDLPQRKLCGFKDEYNNIFLNADRNKNPNRTEMGKTLLHEALHVAFDAIGEPRIEKLEDVLWRMLSLEQQKILKSYIPKHFSKVTPKTV
jgi:hypothetical protein